MSDIIEMDSLDWASILEPLKAIHCDDDMPISKEQEMEDPAERIIQDYQEYQEEEQRRKENQEEAHVSGQDDQGFERPEEVDGQAEQEEQEDADAECDMLSHRATTPSQKKSSDQGERKRKKTRLTRARKRRRAQGGRREITTLLDSNIPLERPTAADFVGFAALPRRDYSHLKHARITKVINEADGQIDGGTNHENDAMCLDQEPFRASSPTIPEHDDDGKEFTEVYTSEPKTPNRRKRKHRRHKEVTYKVKRFSAQETAHRRREESESESESEQEPEREPANFLSLSVEIRDVIYRELLLSRKSIQVHGNWTLVYKGAKRNKLALDASILRVNKRIHCEASRILYGENTFLYLLRDLPNGVANVQSLAIVDDRIIAGQEHESDGEYEGEPVRRNTRRRALRICKDDEFDINLDKYSWLFRKIAVEAEHNRYFEDTQESMANAIRIFTHRPPNDRQTREFNIHTLTIRITPQWAVPVTLDGEGSFTFVNFFTHGSRVLDAIKSVECQYLCVDLLANSLNLNAAHATIFNESRKPCRLFVDMRHLRLWNRLQRGGFKDDWWTRDKVMLYSRKARMNQSLEAIDNLAEHIQQQCHERNFHKWTTDGPIWDSDLDWEDDFVEDEDGWQTPDSPL